ncbi:MAG: hypothetical protein Q7L55_03795, partial [Actinomycetota bacterium]|nr:hypothetical protein [Actinomycetota bacterium]
MIYIGIDPGLEGAIAVMTPEGILLHDMPVVRTPKGQYDAAAMAGLLRLYAGDRQARAVLEAVSGRPGQGTASARSIGIGYGVWLGLLAALEIGHQSVPPGVWKRTLGLLKADKAASRARAVELYPEVAGRLTRVKDHGRAEALL